MPRNEIEEKNGSGALGTAPFGDDAAEGEAPSALKSLIVDDDPVILRLLERAIKKTGYEVTACSNAESAWDLCVEEFFPLIVLDWLMPGMDGLTLCRKLRALPGGDRMVILVVTGNDQPEHLKAVLEAGADDYVTKPIDSRLFSVRLAIAREQIGIKKQRALAEEGMKQALGSTRTILESVPFGVVVMGKDRKIRWVNDAALTMAHLDSPDELLGKSCANLCRHSPEGVCPILDLGQSRHTSEGSLVVSGDSKVHIMKTVMTITLEGEEVLLEAFVDITREKEAAEELEKQRNWLEVTLSSIGDGVLSTDREGNVTFLNPEAERLTGWRQRQARGVPVDEVFPIVNSKTGKTVENPIHQALQNQALAWLPRDTLLLSKEAGRVPIDDSAAPIRDADGQVLGSVLVFRDVTEQVRVEKEIEASLRKVERAKREWETTANALPQIVCLLDDEGCIIRANLTVEEWGLKEISLVPDSKFHDLFHHECNDPACYLRSLWRSARERLSDEKPVECEVEDKVLDRFFRMQFRPILTHREGGQEESGSFAVAVIDDITERKRMEMELEHAREQEIDIGSRIQKSLLIGTPPDDLKGMEVSALTIPSQRIDGDFYAFFKPNDNSLDVIVGDVMGKGIPAALIGAATKSHFLGAMSHLITSSSDRRLPEPMEVVSYVHGEMAQSLIELESFVTLCYARFDLIRRTVKIVDCGHPNTLHFRSAGSDCQALDGVNMPLGFADRETYQQIETPFGPGDSFLFYSDGVIEAQVDSGELFGEERLTEIFRGCGRHAPAELTNRIREAVVDFAGSETFADDLTCIAVRISDEKAALSTAQATITITSSLDELEKARSFVKENARYNNAELLDEENTWLLELAVTEAASNIIRHAYNGKPDQRILIEVNTSEEGIDVKLHHWGNSFNPESVEKPALDGSEDGGFGVYIIENCMDRVTYHKNETGRNSICLVKNRKKP